MFYWNGMLHEFVALGKITLGEEICWNSLASISIDIDKPAYEGLWDYYYAEEVPKIHLENSDFSIIIANDDYQGNGQKMSNKAVMLQ